MDLVSFRKRIKELYYPTGYSQKMLAHELGLQPSALSNKLNGTGETRLKQTEVRQIIKILAQWEALTSQSEVLELLEMMDLRQSSFTIEEWNAPPLNKLVREPLIANRYPNPGDKLETTSALTSRPLALPKQSEKPRHNLPAQPTSFIGRKQQIAQVVGLLRRADVRLLTLTGSGGVGKTRLALQVAEELLADFESGVVFVSLASIREPDLVLSSIARSLDIRESGNQTLLDSITNFLHDKRLLLLLDNFEQVLGALVTVKELIAELPHLKLLITSRTLLHIYGEYEYILPPMTLADSTLIKDGASLVELEQLGSYEAIALFVQRARAAKPSFKLGEDNALVVAEICQRLDGLPLAIEFAAARVKTMSPSFILDRLDHRLTLLNRGPLDLPIRQQTLRTLIDWSYELLDAAEKQLFNTLSVFDGGCDLEAAEAVCGEEHNSADFEKASTILLDKLSDLVDKSMLHLTYNRSGQPRFNMLETLREYALEKLQRSGAQQFIFARHAKYFLELAEQTNQVLNQGYNKDWLDRMEIEHANFRIALGWALSNLEQGQAELALQLAGNLWRFWQMNSHFKESQLTITTVLNKTTPYSQGLDARLRAEVLQGASTLFSISDCTRAIELQQENLALRRAMQDKAGIVCALNELSCLFLHQTNFKQAAFISREGLELARKLADTSGIAEALFHLSVVALFEGNSVQARQYVHDCLQIWQELDDQEGIAFAYAQLGRIALKGGEYKQARTNLLKGLSTFIALDNKIEITKVLGNLAELLTFHQSPFWGAQQATILLGAALSIGNTLGIEMSSLLRSFYNSQVERIQNQVDDNDFAALIIKGGKLNLEQAIALAQQEVELSADVLSLTAPSNSSQSTVSQNDTSSLSDSLTQREVEVLKLVAAGLTTYQTAEELTVSPLTIQSHLRSIYSKLELKSRSDATRYAIENKLI